MKHRFLLLTFIIGFWSCQSKTSSSSSQSAADSALNEANRKKIVSEEMQPIDPSKIECVPELFYPYENYSRTLLSPGTFAENTLLYSSINKNSKVLDTLRINTKVNVLKAYADYYLVCTRTGKTGYIKKTELYLHSASSNSYYNNDGKYIYDDYLIGISKYKTVENKEYGENLLKIIKLKTDNISEVFIDTIPVSYFQIEEVSNTVLKNSTALFHLSYSYYDEIGVGFDHFIIDNGKKLSRLILTSGSGDGGYADYSDVYLPIKLANGNKVVFAKNGILSIDNTNAKPDIIQYPSDSGIPINELVIVQEGSIEPVEDEKGNQKYNEDGTMADGVSIDETIYYRWNGSTLKKVKTIKGS